MSIDSVIAEMYETVCFEPGTRPDWSRQQEIFAPGARVVRVNDEGVFEFDIESFQANFEAMIDSGVLPASGRESCGARHTASVRSPTCSAPMRPARRATAPRSTAA